MPSGADTTIQQHFVEVVQAPRRLLEWPLPLQNRILRLLRRHLMLGAVALGLGEDELPRGGTKLRDQLDAARIHASVYRRQLRWEVRQIVHALAGLEVPVVLLKGAAYEFLNLPNARGRWVSDVDILVPRDALEGVEQALVRHGWEGMKLDEYDQGYYRQWMHELPPLRHRERGTVVDVHHAIAPTTSRLRPDSARLLAAARALEQPPLHVLAPPDMVLHAAVHLFHDGDLSNGLRELYDLFVLMRHFGARAGFWEALEKRAHELGLERPLYYATHHLREGFGFHVPVAMANRLAARRGLASGLVNRAMRERLRPSDEPAGAWRSALASELLYLRSHWLRMPPLMLARHLATKAWMRRQTVRSEDKAAI